VSTDENQAIYDQMASLASSVGRIASEVVDIRGSTDDRRDAQKTIDIRWALGFVLSLIVTIGAFGSWVLDRVEKSFSKEIGAVVHELQEMEKISTSEEKRNDQQDLEIKSNAGRIRTLEELR